MIFIRKNIIIMIMLLSSLCLTSVFGELINNNDGTLTDSETCLMWQKEEPYYTMSYKRALSYCKDLNLAGHSDWRLPTRKEYLSIVDWSPATVVERIGDMSVVGRYAVSDETSIYYCKVRAVRTAECFALLSDLKIEEINISKKELNALETAEISIKLKNIGKIDAKGVYVKLTCKNVGINIPETVKFSTIPAKDGIKTISIPVKGTMDIQDGQAEVKIVVLVQNLKDNKECRKIKFSTRALRSDKQNKDIKNKSYFNYQPKSINTFQRFFPVISLFFPENQRIKTSKSFIMIQGSAFDDQNVSQINFFINGKSVPNIRAIEVDKSIDKRTIKFKKQIPIHVGQNTITIVATDNENLQSKLYIFVERTPQTGKFYACFIGINNYHHYKPLIYAVRDAESYANYLKESMNITDNNIYKILNEDATDKNIKSILGTKLKNMAGKKDTVLIFYAGHGGIEKNSQNHDGLEKYLLPVNAKPDDLFSTAISFNEIRTIFNRIKSERIIFIIDSCFSGSASGPKIVSLGLRSSIDKNIYQRLIQGKGRVIITSSEPNEVSIEDIKFGGGHGVFTYYWLESLKGHADLNNDGYITISEAYSYTYKKVVKETDQNQHPMKIGKFSGDIYIGKVIK